jgi:integrase
MHTAIPSSPASRKAPWNKGRLTGQKRPLKPKDVWAIRVRLQLEGRKRDLALFNLAIDSKLRGCDLLCLQVDDVWAGGGRVRDRGTVIQKKTRRPVQFEITAQARSSIQDWLSESELGNGGYLFPSRFRAHLSTRQYLRIVHAWVERAGLDGRPTARTRCGGRKRRRSTRTRGTCVQCSSSSDIRMLESTVRYLGIEVDDALSISEQVEL